MIEPFSSLSKQFMNGLRIGEHASKFAKNCSGGTKRKLSYAMSMLGNPRIVLLDEPSTGMDPQSKRFVWDTILASFKVWINIGVFQLEQRVSSPVSTFNQRRQDNSAIESVVFA